MDEQRSLEAPHQVSRFNALAVAVSFALTGLTVFYLPNLTDRTLRWEVEGHLTGAAIAVIGIAFILVAFKELTNRESFVAWGVAVLVGAFAYALIAVTHGVTLPSWLAGILLAVAIVLVFVAIYALVIGLADFFDRSATSPGLPVRLPGIRQVSSPDTDGTSEIRRSLSWYERVTLVVAVVSTLATLIGTAVSFIHA